MGAAPSFRTPGKSAPSCSCRHATLITSELTDDSADILDSRWLSVSRVDDHLRLLVLLLVLLLLRAPSAPSSPRLVVAVLGATV